MGEGLSGSRFGICARSSGALVPASAPGAMRVVGVWLITPVSRVLLRFLRGSMDEKVEKETLQGGDDAEAQGLSPNCSMKHCGRDDESNCPIVTTSPLREIGTQSLSHLLNH